MWKFLGFSLTVICEFSISIFLAFTQIFHQSLQTNFNKNFTDSHEKKKNQIFKGPFSFISERSSNDFSWIHWIFPLKNLAKFKESVYSLQGYAIPLKISSKDWTNLSKWLDNDYFVICFSGLKCFVSCIQDGELLSYAMNFGETYMNKSL